MVNFRNFSFTDWLKLKPFNIMFKQFRNDLLLRLFVKKRSPEHTFFIDSVLHLKNKDVVIVVAFEQPWALDWLLRMAKKNFSGVTVLVFDNSRGSEDRAKIEAVCKRHHVHYLGLPSYKTKHVNRSHGMAMSWIYTNVIDVVQPRVFGFLDHDLIPVSHVDFAGYIQSQPFFGRESGNKKDYWSLWAGFCVFDYQYLVGKKINFLYDFSRGLDTGGKNWGSLYSNFDKKDIVFATRNYKTLFLPNMQSGVKVEFIDDKWVHIGSISYNDGFKKKFEFFDQLAKELEVDPNWTRFLNGN